LSNGDSFLTSILSGSLKMRICSCNDFADLLDAWPSQSVCFLPWKGTGWHTLLHASDDESLGGVLKYAFKELTADVFLLEVSLFRFNGIRSSCLVDVIATN
jgi:hypothetical protein